MKDHNLFKKLKKVQDDQHSKCKPTVSSKEASEAGRNQFKVLYARLRWLDFTWEKEGPKVF